MRPLTITLILLANCFLAAAQTGQNAISKNLTPAFLNHIYFCQPDSLVELEQVDGRMISRTKGLGYGGSESGVSIEGEKSRVRLKESDSIHFEIKMGSSMMDPSMIIKLYRLSPHKGNREAIMSSSPGMYGKNKTKDENEISLNVQKINEDVFVITPAVKLSSGEYGFMNSMLVKQSGMKPSFTIFAFGIN